MNSKHSLNSTTHNIITSIRTLPAVLLNQLGIYKYEVIHTYYNPEQGWEIAYEDENKNTHIVICVEKDKIVKLFSQ